MRVDSALCGEGDREFKRMRTVTVAVFKDSRLGQIADLSSKKLGVRFRSQALKKFEGALKKIGYPPRISMQEGHGKAAAALPKSNLKTGAAIRLLTGHVDQLFTGIAPIICKHDKERDWLYVLLHLHRRARLLLIVETCISAHFLIPKPPYSVCECGRVARDMHYMRAYFEVPHKTPPVRPRSLSRARSLSLYLSLTRALSRAVSLLQNGLVREYRFSVFEALAKTFVVTTLAFNTVFTAILGKLTPTMHMLSEQAIFMIKQCVIRKITYFMLTSEMLESKHFNRNQLLFGRHGGFDIADDNQLDLLHSMINELDFHFFRLRETISKSQIGLVYRALERRVCT